MYFPLISCYFNRFYNLLLLSPYEYNYNNNNNNNNSLSISSFDSPVLLEAILDRFGNVVEYVQQCVFKVACLGNVVEIV